MYNDNCKGTSGAATVTGTSGDLYSGMCADMRQGAALQDAMQEERDDTPLVCLTANETLRRAKGETDPRSLWHGLWHEGEACCLFADTGVGKSLYSVQIAEYIAHREKVLYFDFELSRKQFQKRYTADGGTGDLHVFPDNFIRVDINQDYIQRKGDMTDYDLILAIERCALRTKARVLIIDNLTWICTNSESGEDATDLMKELMRIKRQHGWSILVVAHTPKMAERTPITRNSLAGSRKLLNFFDSAFAIGLCSGDTSRRYIKQIKVRLTELRYGEDNVILADVVSEGSMTMLRHTGFGYEADQLREVTEKERDELDSKVMKLHQEGMPVRAIAQRLGINRNKVFRIIKRCSGADASDIEEKEMDV